MKEPDVAGEVGHPRAQPIRPRLAARDAPAHKHESEDTLAQMFGGLSDDLAAHVVAAEPAVTEDQRAVRRDDERRIGHDQVELLAVDGREEAARSALDVLYAIEERVERGEIQRPWIDVASDDLVRVACREHGLDPAAAADIQRALD